MKLQKRSGDFFTISSVRTGFCESIDGQENPCDCLGSLYYGDLAICVEDENAKYIKIITKFGMGFIIPDYVRFKTIKS